jgi:hypothetical protein
VRTVREDCLDHLRAMASRVEPRGLPGGPLSLCLIVPPCR